jgi:hypothetical protein
VYNDNVTKDFADIVKKMMSKRPEDRFDSMWDFLKEFRSVQIFSKRPRKPEISVFDDMPGIKGADELLMKGQPSDLAAHDEQQKKKKRRAQSRPQQDDQPKKKDTQQ